MTTFVAIDQTAAAADKPYSTALAQGIRDNVLASREKRLRAMSKSYELRNGNTPRLVGTYSWSTHNKLVHTMVPFLYVKSSPDVTELDVIIAGDQVGATGTISAIVIPIEDAILKDRFIGLDDVNNIPNGATAFPTVATDTSVTFSGSSALALPASSHDVYMVFIASKSALIGVTAEILDGLAGVPIYQHATSGKGQVGGCIIQYNFNSPHTETLQRPDFAVGFTQGITKTNGWPDIAMPSGRQAIFVDDAGSFRGIYCYPPFDWNLASGVAPNSGLQSNHFSYFDLKSVQIVESAVRSYTPSSALNGAKPASVEAHSVLVTEAEKIDMAYTPVFHCGGTVALDTNDYLLFAGTDGALNKLHNYVEYTTTWTTIGNCVVRPHGVNRDQSGTQRDRVGYRVCAVFAISAPARVTPGANSNMASVNAAPTYDMNVQLLLEDRDGSATQKVGGDETFNRMPANGHPVGLQSDLTRAFYEPVGYLLRAHHIDNNDTSQKMDELLSHSLLGQFPEDVWSTGKYIYYEAEIVDTETTEAPASTDPARLLSIQIQAPSGWTAPTSPNANNNAKTFVHLLTWTVVGLNPGHPQLISEVSV